MGLEEELHPDYQLGRRVDTREADIMTSVQRQQSSPQQHACPTTTQTRNQHQTIFNKPIIRRTRLYYEQPFTNDDPQQGPERTQQKPSNPVPTK